MLVITTDVAFLQDRFHYVICFVCLPIKMQALRARTLHINRYFLLQLYSPEPKTLLAQNQPSITLPVTRCKEQADLLPRHVPVVICAGGQGSCPEGMQ